MSTSETSRYVRLRVELVLEIDDLQQLSAAALARIVADDTMRVEERGQAERAVLEDGAEALAYLVEPTDLVRDVPGVDLTQASWTSELVDHDPDAVEWDLDEDDEDDADGDETGAVGDGGGRF